MATGETNLTIYDNAGRVIKSLVETAQTPGQYEIAWNGRDRHNQPVSSGIYFAALRSAQSVRVIKLMLVR